jgi:ATP-dependent Clp protease ATP-binding subunit ClpA
MSEELARFRERGLDLTVSDEASEFLVRRGLRNALGARPLKKTVQKFIGDAIRDAMNAGAQSSGVLAVSPLNDQLMIQ